MSIDGMITPNNVIYGISGKGISRREGLISRVVVFTSTALFWHTRVMVLLEGQDVFDQSLLELPYFYSWALLIVEPGSGNSWGVKPALFMYI
jgi:hypothetical protein